MPVQTTNELKEVLFDAYGGFGDKRYKDKTRDLPFIVDDRSEGDEDARGRLFLWFCQMFLTVGGPGRVKLTLRGGIPESAGVAAWLEEQGAHHTNMGTEVLLTPDNLAALDDLISQFAAIIAGPYDTRAYKYVVPRVCASLDRLKRVLTRAWC